MKYTNFQATRTRKKKLRVAQLNIEEYHGFNKTKNQKVHINYPSSTIIGTKKGSKFNKGDTCAPAHHHCRASPYLTCHRSHCCHSFRHHLSAVKEGSAVVLRVVACQVANTNQLQFSRTVNRLHSTIKHVHLYTCIAENVSIHTGTHVRPLPPTKQKSTP